MILLVEDDAASRFAFARLLRREGYEVIEAGDGNEAAFAESWLETTGIAIGGDGYFPQLEPSGV